MVDRQLGVEQHHSLGAHLRVVLERDQVGAGTVTAQQAGDVAEIAGGVLGPRRDRITSSWHCCGEHGGAVEPVGQLVERGRSGDAAAADQLAGVGRDVRQRRRRRRDARRCRPATVRQREREQRLPVGAPGRSTPESTRCVPAPPRGRGTAGDSSSAAVGSGVARRERCRPPQPRGLRTARGRTTRSRSTTILPLVTRTTSGREDCPPVAIELTTVADDEAVVYDGGRVTAHDGLTPDTDYDLDGIAFRTLARPGGERLATSPPSTTSTSARPCAGCSRASTSAPSSRASPGEPPYPETMNRGAITEIAAIEPDAVVVKGDLTDPRLARGVRRSSSTATARLRRPDAPRARQPRRLPRRGLRLRRAARDHPARRALAVLDTVIPAPPRAR